MSATASRVDTLNEILDTLALNMGGDVNGSAIVSTDGIIYAARFLGNVNVDRVGAIAATSLGVSLRVARDLNMGSPSETIIQGENGYFIVIPVNDKSLLAVSLRRGGNLGMIRLEANDCAKRIATVIV